MRWQEEQPCRRGLAAKAPLWGVRQVAQEAEVEQVEEAAPAPAADAEPAAEEGQGAEAEAEAGATPAAERPAVRRPRVLSHARPQCGWMLGVAGLKASALRLEATRDGVRAGGSVTVDWQAKRSAHVLPLRAPQADAPKEAGSYTLNFLWLDKNVAVSVDQMFSKVCARWERGAAAACVAGVHACRVPLQGIAWGPLRARREYECHVAAGARARGSDACSGCKQARSARACSLLTGAWPCVRRRSGAR